LHRAGFVVKICIFEIPGFKLRQRWNRLFVFCFNLHFEGAIDERLPDLPLMLLCPPASVNGREVSHALYRPPGQLELYIYHPAFLDLSFLVSPLPQSYAHCFPPSAGLRLPRNASSKAVRLTRMLRPNRIAHRGWVSRMTSYRVFRLTRS